MMIAYSGIDLFETTVSPVIFVYNITTFYNNGTITVHLRVGAAEVTWLS
jgi:hypothetical protein